MRLRALRNVVHAVPLLPEIPLIMSIRPVESSRNAFFAKLFLCSYYILINDEIICNSSPEP